MNIKERGNEHYKTGSIEPLDLMKAGGAKRQGKNKRGYGENKTLLRYYNLSMRRMKGK
ncbi:MAG: hypothetical protein H5T45_01435 [Thermoplasmatales archaeon]|nr:hypothetical protein [Thermoplasmatales archaeon]